MINSMGLDTTNPNTPPRFGVYVEKAIPMVMARGTQVYAVSVPVEVLQGEYDEDFLFITEWVGENAIDAYHADERSLSIDHFSNYVLTRWLEAVLAKACPLPTRSGYWRVGPQ